MYSLFMTFFAYFVGWGQKLFKITQMTMLLSSSPGNLLQNAEITLLTLSLTGVGPFGPSLTYIEFALKVLKIRYRQKLGIPQAGS